MTTVDNRDLVNFTEYQQDRIEALRRKVAELVDAGRKKDADLKLADEQIQILHEVIATMRMEAQ